MKKIIFTVDTEGHIGCDPVTHLIMGQLANGKYAGIPLIMDICDRYGIKALFFVDFAEAWDYGKKAIADIVTLIIHRGHDVGVHIHPDHMADNKRLFLSEYSKEEQYEIISACTDLYREITGTQPLAFRAGKYGANRDTLDILAQLGYKYDFSEFFGYDKWCGIHPPVTGNETVCLENGLIEVPVMSYHNKVPYIFDRYDKLDLNTTLVEHQYIFNKIVQEPQIQVISLFAHSFSLIHWRINPNRPSPKVFTTNKLKYILKNIKNRKDCTFVKLTDIETNNTPSTANSVTSIPCLMAAMLFIFKAIGVVSTRIEKRISIWNMKKE